MEFLATKAGSAFRNRVPGPRQSSLDALLAVEKYLLVNQGVFRKVVIRGPVGYVMDNEHGRRLTGFSICWTPRCLRGESLATRAA
jgi:hypothetical protein